MKNDTTPAVGQDAKHVVDPHDAYVLVVEDNLQNLVLIARLLAFLGVQRYEWKASGWQVLEFADTMPRVDLVLMDIHLPYEDGYDALKKMRADMRFKDTQVVAVTADANPASLEKARSAGFDGFLGKPIDPDRFPDILDKTVLPIQNTTLEVGTQYEQFHFAHPRTQRPLSDRRSPRNSEQTAHNS